MNDDILRVVVFGAITIIPLVAMGGIRRWPWRYATLGALGWLLVAAAGSLWVEQIDPPILVGLGAVGGSLATIGFERGERARARRSAYILEGRTSALD